MEGNTVKCLSKCNDGFYPSNEVCTPCEDSNCFRCSSSNKCDKCH